MKKYILTIIISLLIGFLLSNYVLKKYEGNILPTFKETKIVYLIQQGVYSNIDSMKKNTTNFTDYIYSEKDNLFYVYIGLSNDLENVKKIQDYYSKKNIKTIIKTTDSDIDLEKYDDILKQTDDSDTIGELVKQMLRKYKGE